ncbi:MAG: folate-binding protein [Hyphomonadaceae bacterium]
MMNADIPSARTILHRAILSVEGDDAETFLQGLLTCGVLGLSQGERRFGALLTPQGKIISELLIERTAEGFLLDCPASVAPDLKRKLSMFRLRAKVAIAERNDLEVAVFDGAPDPRSPALPSRAYTQRSDAAPSAHADDGPYHAARITAGVPEQDADFASGEVFPADVNLDLLGGVDFRKGCFVGQEVVSRMHRRGTARRRTLKVRLPGGFPNERGALPAAFSADGLEIGQVTSAAGGLGLARIRIDRLANATAPLVLQDGREITVDPPAWLEEEERMLRKDAKTT